VSSYAVTVTPGNEGQIKSNLDAGNDVELQSGQTYILSKSEWIYLNDPDNDSRTLNGNGATLELDGTFNNIEYDAGTLHNSPHINSSPSPTQEAFAIYIGPGRSGITIKNLKIKLDADTEYSKVVRAISMVRALNITIENVEVTGSTIGPIIDIVDSHNIKIFNSKIYDVVATGNISSEPTTAKPNLTGILIDDVDLFSSSEQREDESMHSTNINIYNNKIQNLRMYNLTYNDGSTNKLVENQTDAINIQRGQNISVLNNLITDVDEGIDLFSSHGLVLNNTIYLSSTYCVYDEIDCSTTSAGIKMVHGAAHNQVYNNLVKNRNIAVMHESSYSPGNLGNCSTKNSITKCHGVYGNYTLFNSFIGSYNKYIRVSYGTGNATASSNFFFANSGATNSSDCPGSCSETNHYNGSPLYNFEPDFILTGDFHQNGKATDLAIYKKSTGKTDLFFRTRDGVFEDIDDQNPRTDEEGFNFDLSQNGVCKLTACNDQVYCPPNNIKSGCESALQNMEYVFTGRFFVGSAPYNKTDLLYLDTSGSYVIDRFQRNDGNGTFSQFSHELGAVNTISAIYEKVVAGDFNGDGKTDLFFHSTNDGNSRGYRNDDSNGTSNIEWSSMSNEITPSKIDNESGNAIVAIKTGDFNGDGKTDLLFVWYDGTNKIFLGNNGLTFSTEKQITSSTGQINGIASENDITVMDIDGDGYDDIIFLLSTSLKRTYMCTGCSSSTLSYTVKEQNF